MSPMNNHDSQFNGRGTVYLIQRSLNKTAHSFFGEMTDEVLDEFVWSDSKQQGEVEDDENLVLVASIRDAPLYDGLLLPFPMPQHTYERITKHLQVPQSLLQIAQRCIPLQVSGKPARAYNESMDEYINFIILSAANTQLFFIASFSCHIKSRQMYIFIHGLRSPHMEHILRQIYSRQPFPLNTFWSIPSMLIEQYFCITLSSLELSHEDIFRLEKATGVRWDSDRHASLEDIEFTKLTREINFAMTNLAHKRMAYKTYRPMLDFLDECMKSYRILAVPNQQSEKHAADTERLVLDKQQYLRSWLDGMQRREEYLSHRGEALFQTIYNMIAQKDNSLNRQMTQASLELTKASQELAIHSQDVAIAATRDGALMRIIAVLTIFFLPATFTATFFSTSFFDFKVGPHERVYSWWIWLYFVVTVILTGIVLVCWFVLSKQKEKEIMGKFTPPTKLR